MTTTITPPEWLQVGAEVAILQSRAGFSRTDVIRRTVDRVNAKSVTIDGERYPLDTLMIRYGGSYGSSRRLADPQSAEVRALLGEQIRRARIDRAIDALQKWRDDPTRVDLARDAIDRLASFLSVADEVRS